jgi:tRNA pseudouridine55 synthase
MISGWININKPHGITSAQMVWQVKKLLKILDSKVKIGHTGTLDPFATGVLPLAIGEATKLVNIATDKEKEYLFKVKFGAETDTYDLEGVVTFTTETIPTEQQILAIIPDFIGIIAQVPPKYSAIKVGGQRSYDLARKNADFTLNARDVNIKELELISYMDGVGYFRVLCGKGTYVRSLARDIAYKLDSLGYVIELHRKKVGKFDDSNIILLDSLKEIVHNGGLVKYILPIDLVLDDILVLEVNEQIAQKVRYGQNVSLYDLCSFEQEQIALKYNGILLAIGSLKEGNFKSQRVFNL